MLQAAITKAALMSNCWLVKRSLNRNRNGKGILTPTTPNMAIIWMSSRMSEVAPIMCCMLAK